MRGNTSIKEYGSRCTDGSGRYAALRAFSSSVSVSMLLRGQALIKNNTKLAHSFIPLSCHSLHSLQLLHSFNQHSLVTHCSYCIHSSTPSFTHSLIHSLSLSHAFTHSHCTRHSLHLLHSLKYSITHSFSHTHCTHRTHYDYIHSITQSLNHSPTDSHIHPHPLHPLHSLVTHLSLQSLHSLNRPITQSVTHRLAHSSTPTALTAFTRSLTHSLSHSPHLHMQPR